MLNAMQDASKTCGISRSGGEKPRSCKENDINMLCYIVCTEPRGFVPVNRARSVRQTYTLVDRALGSLVPDNKHFIAQTQWKQGRIDCKSL